MPVQPYVYIDPPAVEPYEYGIFGAAKPVTPTELSAHDANGDTHWLWGGVEWESLANYPTSAYPAGSAANIFAGSGGTKALAGGQATTKLLPFVVYGGVECGTQGRVQSEHRQRALRILAQNGQHSVENALWTGAGGQLPALNATGTPDLTPTPGTAVSLLQAVRLLENWLADNYGGRGFLHAKRGVSAGAAWYRQAHVDKDNPQALVTKVGTRWVFGGGYDGTGPAAAAVTGTKTWVYATGQVLIVQGDVDPSGSTLEAELFRTTNQVFAIAEQPYLVGFDGPHAGVLVDTAL